MELSNRLLGIIKMVNKKSQIGIDVGSDHGYIPIYLVKNGICKRFIASDVKPLPLEKARKNIENEGLLNKIELRQGSGLKVVLKNEVNFAILCGMGGYLIRDLLEESFDVVSSLEYMILQPMQNIEVLREYIYKRGYEILDERIVWDEFYYQIYKIKAGDLKYTDEYKNKYSYFGEKLFQNKDIFVSYALDKRIDDLYKILDLLTGNSYLAKKRRIELYGLLKNLEEIKNEYNSE
ncbi:MAG: class I SAM-dependent methyltransferase [Oscillospiraceae bacterium]|nr:class I SAM-dependent methyltransferase [Oscillospiraceae bacterium]